MKASIRVNSLSLGGSGPKTIGAMEAHGKRLDKTSKLRRIRDQPPLVYGSLDLRDAFHKHVSGCRKNSGLKRPVMHALIQFPKQLKVTEANQQRMLKFAVEFINVNHGGDAVFAARLDRDELSQHVVDVFYTPKYKKITKSRGEETWISTTKHAKELCKRHRDEIEKRHGGRFLTGPRQIGIALQSELRRFLRTKNLNLAPKQQKDHYQPDRVEPEVYKAQQLDANLAEVLTLHMRLGRTREDLERSVKQFQRLIQSLPMKGGVRASVSDALTAMVGALRQADDEIGDIGQRAAEILDRIPVVEQVTEELDTTPVLMQAM